MVALIEVVLLVAVTLAGVVWLRRTPLYQANKRSGIGPSQHGSYATFGFSQPRPTLPPEALRELQRHRGWWGWRTRRE